MLGRGVLPVWIRVGQRSVMLAIGAGGGCLDIFSLVYHSSFLSPSLWETAQYRLKYCLKEPLSPKQPTNQPTSRQLFHIDKILSQSAVKPRTTDQPTNQHKDPLIIYSLIKVFSSTNCPYHGMKVTCFGKSVKVFTGALSSFTIKSLQNDTYNAINK